MAHTDSDIRIGMCRALLLSIRDVPSTRTWSSLLIDNGDATLCLEEVHANSTHRNHGESNKCLPRLGLAKEGEMTLHATPFENIITTASLFRTVAYENERYDNIAHAITLVERATVQHADYSRTA
jgi:hypothetical protein